MENPVYITKDISCGHNPRLRAFNTKQTSVFLSKRLTLSWHTVSFSHTHIVTHTQIINKYVPSIHMNLKN